MTKRNSDWSTIGALALLAFAVAFAYLVVTVHQMDNKLGDIQGSVTGLDSEITDLKAR